MKRILSHLTLALVYLGPAFASDSLAAPPVTNSVHAVPAGIAASEIALRPGGLLVGKVIDSQGVGKAAASVTIVYGQHEVVTTSTDANGIFAARGLRGGQYLILTSEGPAACRLWAEGTAPPSAQSAAIISPASDTVRGQFGYGYGKAWVEWMKAHPYLTAGTVAAAIAIPIAFADNDWDSGS